MHSWSGEKPAEIYGEEVELPSGASYELTFELRAVPTDGGPARWFRCSREVAADAGAAARRSVPQIAASPGDPAGSSLSATFHFVIGRAPPA